MAQGYRLPQAATLCHGCHHRRPTYCLRGSGWTWILPTWADADAPQLARRYVRERTARLEAERIAEQATRRLYLQGERLAAALVQERALRDELESLLAALEAFSGALELEQVAGLLHQYLLPLIPHGRLVLEAGEDQITVSGPEQAQPWHRVTFPIETPAGVLGVVELAAHASDPPAASARMAAAIVRSAAAAVEIALALRAAERQARADPLTNLLNRRGLQVAVRTPLVRGGSPGADICVVMLDLDHFKSVNDQHGHAFGDAVLVAVAQLCSAAFRATDIVARIGGEEFAIILPGTPLAVAKMLMERLRDRIEQLRFPLPGDPDGGQVVVTASAGIATWEWPEDLLAETLERADRALYQAKVEGRNRCVAWRTEFQGPAQPR